MTDEVINLPAPLTDVCRRWKHMLFPEYTRPIERGDPLLPVAVAQTAIAELDDALHPMDFEEAKGIAKRLLAIYPQTASKAGTEAHQIFVTGLIQILMQHPLEIAEAAVAWMMQHKTFLHHADLAQACESQTFQLRRAKAIAEAYLKAAEDQPAPAMSADDKAEIADLLAKAASRLKNKSLPLAQREARERVSAVRGMSESEFDAYMHAEQERMIAEEPAYRARMAKASAYVLGLQARKSGKLVREMEP